MDKIYYILGGGGKAEKSYLLARDLGRAIQMVAENAPLGVTYNAGPAQPIFIREFVERTAGAFGVPFGDIYEITIDRLAQDSRYWLGSTQIKNDLAWVPLIDYEATMAEVVEWGN